MNNGFIVVYRSLLDWEWYSDANTTRLFIHCLLRANHKDKAWQGITIERGSFVTSYQHLALDLGLTVQNIRTSLNKLKSTGELTHKSHAKYGIITINNYDKFQDTNTQTNTQLTVNQQSTNSQLTTNNNENKETKKQGNKKEKYGNFVSLTKEQYKNLIDEFGVALTTTIIERMNEYIGMKGKTYKDYNLAIRKWIREEIGKNPKWLAELKIEQEQFDNIKIEPKRNKTQLEDAWNKL